MAASLAREMGVGRAESGRRAPRRSSAATPLDRSPRRCDDSGKQHHRSLAMRLRIALAALGLAATASAAHASPQLLALLSTDGTVPLHCQGAVCSAELSAFCLERHRATPEAGTLYQAAPNAALVLVVTAADGSSREIDARRLA